MALYSLSQRQYLYDAINAENPDAVLPMGLDNAIIGTPKAITDPMIRPRFNDYDSLVYCGGPHLAGASAVATANSANIESITSTALTANVNWMIVLELIP